MQRRLTSRETSSRGFRNFLFHFSEVESAASNVTSLIAQSICLQFRVLDGEVFLPVYEYMRNSIDYPQLEGSKN